MSVQVLIEAARCVECGMRFKRYAFDGDPSDTREFPALMPIEDVLAGAGKCAHCGGMVMLDRVTEAPLAAPADTTEDR